MSLLVAAASLCAPQSSTATVISPGDIVDATTTVRLGPAQFLLGGVRNTTKHFLGIPFAAPPLGDLRFAPPVTASAWTGIRTALEPGNSCMQKNKGYTIGSNVSEDCLYLNVWAPANSTATSGLPVLLFLYGGSWDSGSSTCPVYYAGDVVGATDATVVVSANYRVNAFGYLGGELLRSGGTGGSTGNWGQLDQREAMRWVQRHVAAFGGDPGRVLLFGESAGAGSVAAHLVSPLSFAAVDGPLFQAAGMQSGSPASPWVSQNMR